MIIRAVKWVTLIALLLLGAQTAVMSLGGYGLLMFLLLLVFGICVYCFLQTDSGIFKR